MEDQKKIECSFLSYVLETYGMDVCIGNRNDLTEEVIK